MSMFSKDTTPLLRRNSQLDEHMSMTVITPKPSSNSTESNAISEERINSLDQYRGFIVLCLLVVPLLGQLDAAPDVLKHKKNFFSIADATMPQFYLIIGYSMELTHRRLRAKKGLRAMILKQLRRSRTLYLMGLLYHSVDNQQNWANLRENWPKLFLQPILGRKLFQTLSIIAVAQLVILPVITRSCWIRVCYLIGTMAIYMLGQWAFWLKYQWEHAVDGGSFGAFSWAFMMITGTLLYDWCKWASSISTKNIITRRHRMIKASIGLLLVAGISWTLAYFISCIPASWSPVCYSVKTGQSIACPNISLPSIPFVTPETDVVSMWTMSHRLATLSIHLAAVGYSLPMYLFWFILAEYYNVQFKFLNILSKHSLLLYILNDYATKLATNIVPNDSPLYMMPVLVLIGLGGDILIIKFLEMNNISVRL